MHVIISVALGWLTSEEKDQMSVYPLSLSCVNAPRVLSALMDGVLLLVQSPGFLADLAALLRACFSSTLCCL